MKRLLLFVLVLISTLLAYPKGISHEIVEFYFPSLIGLPFGDHVKISVNGEGGKVRLEYSNHQQYNAREFENYAAYSIPVGSRLYLKLSNDEVITLTCEEYKDVKDRLVEGKVGVYQGYVNQSYFPLDENTISLLRNFEIVKIRAELKKGILDGSFKWSEQSKPKKPDFNAAYDYVIEKMREAEEESARQQELQNNPLQGF